MDAKGNTYICEREGHGVRMVNANAVMPPYAGTGERGYDGDGGPALTPTSTGPKAIRCDHRDNVFALHPENHAARPLASPYPTATTTSACPL